MIAILLSPDDAVLSDALNVIQTINTVTLLGSDGTSRRIQQLLHEEGQ